MGAWDRWVGWIEGRVDGDGGEDGEGGGGGEVFGGGKVIGVDMFEVGRCLASGRVLGVFGSIVVSCCVLGSMVRIEIYPLKALQDKDIET